MGAVDVEVGPECGSPVTRDGEHIVGDRQLDVLPSWHEHASVCLHELDVAASLPELGSNREERATTGSREDAEWLPRDLRRPLLERFVDRRPQLPARHDVDEHRCKDDAQRYGYGRGYRDAGAETHERLSDANANRSRVFLITRGGRTPHHARCG